MRTSRILVSLLAGAALAAPAVPSATAVPDRAPAAAKPAYREYVALGDSWTADVVILNGDGFPATEHAPVGCAQSHRNYPKLVAKAIGARTFRDASCGSATTDDFTRPQTGLPTGGANPPQFDRLTKRTDLVTVGIGGNDAGIASAGMDCLNLLPIENPLPDGLLPQVPIPFVGGNLPPLGGCKKKYTKGGVDRLARNIREAEPKLVRALRQIHRISPRARILVVDYMRVIPDHACYPRCRPPTRTWPTSRPSSTSSTGCSPGQRGRAGRSWSGPTGSRSATTSARDHGCGTPRRWGSRSTTWLSACRRTPTRPAPAPRPHRSCTTCETDDGGRLRSA